MTKQIETTGTPQTIISWQKISNESLTLNSERVVTISTVLDSPQLSFLKKHDRALLITRVTLLLNDIRKYCQTQFDEKTTPDLAKSLIESFWWLRFDELIYVLRNGVNGVYGKIYGILQYATITDWITEYTLTERETAEAQKRVVPKQDETPIDPEKYEKTTKAISELAEQLTFKAREEKWSETKSTLSDAQIDERQWGYFQALKNEWTLQQLYDELAYAKHRNWLKTAEAIEGEIHTRTL